MSDAAIDVVTAVTAPDPDRIYRRVLRGACPFWSDPHGAWVVAHAEAVNAVLSHESCLVHHPDAPVPPNLIGTGAGGVRERFARFTEGPRHAVLKSALTSMLADFELDEVRAATRRMGDRYAASGDLDRYLVAVPVGTVATLIGLPQESLNEVVAATSSLVRALAPGATAEEIVRGSEGGERLCQMMRQLLEQPAIPEPLASFRRDLATSGIVDHELVVANVVGLLFQAHDATAGLIGNSLVWIARHAEDEELPETVMEIVTTVARVDPAVHNTRRYAGRDLSIGDREIARGDTIIVSLAAANLDSVGECWSFGAGRHACPGRDLALVIAAEAVPVAVERGLVRGALPSPKSYRPLGNVRIPVFAVQPDSGTRR